MTGERIESLADAYDREIDRCRDLLEEYRKISTGAWGAAIITDLLERAKKARRDGDVVEMLRLYHELQQTQ